MYKEEALFKDKEKRIRITREVGGGGGDGHRLLAVA